MECVRQSNCYAYYFGLVGAVVVLIFFFSSRRRHTRCSRDWSSDVCSSDLFRIVSSEEQSSNTRHFFHFRSFSDPITNSGPRRGRGDLWLYGCLRSDAELVPTPDEARPENK